MPQHRFWNLLSKKLSGEATHEELTELEDLMRQHPDWLYSAQHIQDLWKMKAKQEQGASESAFLNHLAKMQSAGVSIDPWIEDEPSKEKAGILKPIWKRWMIAASLIGLLGILSWSIFKTGKASTTIDKSIGEVSTRLGSKSKLVLPDGSTVWLNGGSKLTYNKDFGTAQRQVSLEGEAYFDVMKMQNLPFIIETKAIKIKVLGTSFNVKSYPDEATTETSLVRGKVEITLNRRPDEKFILHPNEKLVVANDVERDANRIEEKKLALVRLEQLTISQRDSAIIETSWKDNKLAFQDESFAEIARKMERWYNVKIQFQYEDLQNERMTGSFENETVVQALEALQISTDFHFSIQGNVIAITK